METAEPVTGPFPDGWREIKPEYYIEVFVYGHKKQEVEHIREENGTIYCLCDWGIVPLTPKDHAWIEVTRN